MLKKFRIIEKGNGFGTKWYVQQKNQYFFGWTYCINPDHKQWTGTDFPSEAAAREYISKARMIGFKRVVETFE